MKKLIALFVLGLSLFTFVGCKKDGNKEEFDLTKNITTYTRDTTSGTRDGFFTGIGFKEAISDNTVLVSGYVEVAGNGEIINGLKNDEYGIGYISLSSLEGSTLKGLKYNDVEPTEANVISGTYKLTRNFNYIVRNEFDSTKKEQLVEAFVAYMNTVDGKSTIKDKDGIVEILATDKLWEDIKSNYPVVNEDNSDVTLYFGGSTSVEKIAKALSAEFSKKAGNFVVDHNHTGSGDAYKNTQGSGKNSTNKLDIAFASREFKTEELGAEGTYGRICIDAIVVAVNSKNTVLTNVSAELLKKVYQGTFTKWSEVK